MGRRYWVFVLFVLAGASCAPATRDDNWDACRNSIPEAIIFGCSAVIDAGTDTKRNIAVAYHNRGVAHLRKGEYDRAIKDFGKTIALNPEDVFAYNYRGNAYNGKGEYDRSIKDLDKAIALDPEYANAYFNRGYAYEKLGNRQKAEADYQKVLSLRPGDAYATAGLRRLKAAP